MIDALRIGVCCCLLAAPAVAQSVAPTPRPSDAERAVLTEERAAIAEATAGVEVPAIAEAVRPLTAEERARFSAQLGQCWNTGAIDPEAERVAVVVGFELTRDGQPVVDSIELISATPQDPALAEPFFQAARRAIVRCAGDGYDLPAASFAQWQRIEMTFDPNQAGSQ